MRCVTLCDFGPGVVRLRERPPHELMLDRERERGRDVSILARCLCEQGHVRDVSGRLAYCSCLSVVRSTAAWLM